VGWIRELGELTRLVTAAAEQGHGFTFVAAGSGRMREEL